MGHNHDHEHNHTHSFKSDIERRELALKDIEFEFSKLELDNLSEDEIKVEVIFNSIKASIENGVDEMKDIARVVLGSLKKISQDSPVSDSYIKSMFNFDNVYIVLYDLLDLAKNHTYQQREKSNDYRDGIIDSIVALRRFQRFKGYGDYEWEPNYNHAIDTVVPDRNM